MKILITGADGFIGKNLCFRLGEIGGFDVVLFSRQTPLDKLNFLLHGVGAVIHLAGANRPTSSSQFDNDNVGFTRELCDALAKYSPNAALFFSSSIQAELPNPYGLSKRAAEDIVGSHGSITGAPLYIWRLPNVFGKWSRPNYNSAVATFCYNISRGLPIAIIDPAAPINLVYIDDVVETWVNLLCLLASGQRPAFHDVSPVYQTTVGDLASLILGFRNSRDSLIAERVGAGFARALYSTYVSFLPPEAFAYDIPMYVDKRGVFVEMLKTKDSGQFSFFTAHPGVTRGGHYHHTKTEKFLVIKGKARFKFRHIRSGETHQFDICGDKSQIVETVPGWTHDITNIGIDEMVVMLWANEIFDRQRPDTFTCPL